MDIYERLNDLSPEQLQRLDVSIDQRIGRFGVRAFASENLRESDAERIRNIDAALQIARLQERRRQAAEAEAVTIKVEEV